MISTAAKFSHHESCPRCGSKDNLGVWSDGHKWCFGCHYYVGPDGQAILKEWTPRKIKAVEDHHVVLPEGFEQILPKWAREWLYSYHMDDEQIMNNKIGYDLEKDLLIFPVYGESGQLLMWQGRYFGHNPNHPKYLTKGKPADIIHLIQRDAYIQDTVCVVEDMVSAIRVGDHMPGLPIFGSHLSLQQATRLSKMFPKMILYLDKDKFKESIQMQRTYSMLFDRIEIRSSTKDPKYYGTADLRDILLDPNVSL